MDSQLLVTLLVIESMLVVCIQLGHMGRQDRTR